MRASAIVLYRYRNEDGDAPFTRWLDKMADKQAQARVRIRIRQLEAGNFGDVAAVGSGVMELRIHIGAGHRVYFARWGAATVILFTGGDKKSQAVDIKQAKAMWSDWKKRQI